MNLNYNLVVTYKAVEQIVKVILVCEIHSLRRVQIHTLCFPDTR